MKNPFSVKTPETLTSNDIAELFIDVFSDFPRILAPEHTFIHGPRGTGKSMMLRYLEPQVQLAAHKVSEAKELEHFAVLMPIKNANYSLSELERLDGAPYWLLAEHFLISNGILHILNSLEKLNKHISNNEHCIIKFINNIKNLANDVGCEVSPEKEYSSIRDLYNLFDQERRAAKNYIRKLAFEKTLIPYENALFAYEDFFIPFISYIRKLSITPSGPIYLMLDDADNLPLRMQKILNGWVSYRSTNDVCLKISTQQRYKTWRTTQNILIESSHDFSEVDISAVYTSKNFSHYYDRVEQVVKRRLEINGYTNTNPLDFFPVNEEQKLALDIIKEQIGVKWDKGERVSSRRTDDITRYTSSEYLKQLVKIKKTNTFSYAGFRSMVDISSGMIRFFLEPAARMFAELSTHENVNTVETIPYKIQDSVLYKWSEEFVLEEFERLKKDEATQSSAKENKVEKLKSLINGLGELFQSKLLSSDSERRLISFMITKAPPPNVQEVLDLAVEWGYLHLKTIARKEGIGRNILYTLNRRLAPYFKLDPSGYAAHISITPEDINIATHDHRTFVRNRLNKNQTNSDETKQSVLDI